MNDNVMKEDKTKMMAGIKLAEEHGIDWEPFWDDEKGFDLDGLQEEVRKSSGPDWAHITGGDKPRAIGHEDNTLALLDFYGVTCRYNEMSKELDVDIPNNEIYADTESNAKLTIVRDYARLEGYPTRVIEEHLDLIGNRNCYHPARDWILSKSWDGKDRLGQLLDTIDTPDEKLARKLVWRWLVSGIAAIFMKKGFKPQGVLTLVGDQGLGKTRWLTSLVPESEWVKDGVVLDTKNKDSVLQVVSHWIVELGELDATFNAHDIAALKGFITMEADVLRPPYAKRQNRYARKTIFCGSVNDRDFLVDTENRRYWVIEVDSLNPNHTIDVQQLWAQVHRAWKENNEPHWLTPDEATLLAKHNEQYKSIDPIIERFEDHFLNPKEYDTGGEVFRLNATAICREMDISNPNKKDTNKLAAYLRNKGFDRSKSDKSFFVIKKIAGKDYEKYRVVKQNSKVLELVGGLE